MAKALKRMVLYEFGPYRLDPVKRLLQRDGEFVQVAPKALDLLIVLVENGGRVVEKNELIAQLWPDSFVEEMNLTVYVSALRKALGESPDEHRFILTAPRRGYSFVAEVNEVRYEEPYFPPLALAERGPVAAPKPIENHTASIERQTGTEVAVAAETPVSKTAAKPGRAKRLLALSAMFMAVLLTIILIWLSVSETLNRSSNSPSYKTIAVLPFKLIGSQDQDQEYLELGMANALIIRLSNVDQITVRPVSSIFKYVGQGYDPVAAGRELEVDAVMEGTIQQRGDRVRLTVSLIGSADGKTIWADRFDESRVSIFAVQDSISEQVAQALSIKLTSSDKEQLTRHQTQDTDAYSAYSKGIYFCSKRTPDALEKSVASFQQAIELDPNYALAYAGLADAAGLIGYHSDDINVRAINFEKARVAAEKALAIDEALAEAHIARALVRSQAESDMEGAERELRRAIELAPNNSLARLRYGWILYGLGQFERAAQEMRRAVEIDPVSVINLSARANLLFYLGQYDECIAECTKALELDPDFKNPSYYRGLAYEQKREYDRAIQDIRRSGVADVDVLEALGHINGKSGRVSEAQKIVQDLKRLIDKDSAAIYSIALVYAGLGDKDMAFQWLEKGAAAGARRSILFRRDPRLDWIRDDPRFGKFLRSLSR